jgi:succinate dehydrogenase / fumarate reductase cytochrome b subunit
MIVFLLLHLGGNLEIFAGPVAVNQYAQFLRTMPKILWGFRLLLIASVIIHIWLTISLATANVKARPYNYQLKKSRKATLSSRTMMVSGITVLVFICYHLAHYTFGITNPELMKLTDHEGRHHVYNMMVIGFSHPLVSIIYIAAQGLLAFHLSHGISSTARTLGVSNRALYEKIRKGGMLFAGIIAILYISIPFSVWLGFIPLDY